jgi:hypothetical protein
MNTRLDPRDVFHALFAREKELWSEILGCVDDSPDLRLEDCLRTLETKARTLVWCPYSNKRFQVNPDVEKWKKALEHENEIAIVSVYPLSELDKCEYIAVCFNGSAARLGQLPTWATGR